MSFTQLGGDSLLAIEAAWRLDQNYSPTAATNKDSGDRRESGTTYTGSVPDSAMIDVSDLLSLPLSELANKLNPTVGFWGAPGLQAAPFLHAAVMM